MELTVESVQALAPDDASVKAARGLVAPAKWPTLGYSETAFWGECKGSGSRPYQVRIDRQDLACKCSCPSRKFPCKHSLALLLLQVQHTASFTAGEPPEWVSEWLTSRQQRAVRKEEKKEQAEAKAADPQAAAKREAARNQKMTAGLDFLEQWMHDLIRHGLAQISAQQLPFAGIAARMVDAQLPGIAARLNNLITLFTTAEVWPSSLCKELGQLQLIIDAWRQQQMLSPAQLSDLYAALGIPPDKHDVTDGLTCLDNWQILGQSAQEENNLWRRRVWLYGEKSHRTALLLDYSHGGKNFPQHFITGQVCQGALAFFPGASPLRARVVEPFTRGERFPLAELPLPDAQHDMAQRLSANPWQWPLPLRVSEILIYPHESGWRFVSTQGQHLPTRLSSDEGWRLLAASGGAPFMLMGEWDGQQLTPCSAWLAGSVIWATGGAQ
ncbi:SWIM zinc finger family protein [Escherichia coli]|uniref:SWIM zinc finger family protein n=1 Tax=Escherichia coli TaxID=562 RepID=UPI000A1845ED|nr:SWIM zinc finger family protein [Escherichia coli]EFE7138360.1 SWIM zinc finger family protein [Escherichia coli]MCN4574192.1 SWIM zinc finger domain-containing protein [Escherichia coli]OSL26959.1 putative SWIM zinc finger protein [Escherichia coli TA255]